MRIIENRHNAIRGRTQTPSKTYNIECEHCGSTFELEEKDLKDVQYLQHGCPYYKCPCCGEMVDMCDHIEPIELTPDNLRFPQHYYHFNGDKGMSCDEIDKDVKTAIEFLKENKDSSYYFIGTGNTIICVYNMTGDEEYLVHVCQKYYEIFVPYEK